MKKAINYMLIGTLILSTIVILSGCEKNKNNIVSKATENGATSIQEEMSEDIEEVETKPEKSEELKVNEALGNDNRLASLLGTYIYMPGDDEEERIFEIGQIAEKYYIEYMGGYDYAAGEIEVVNVDPERMEGITYDVVIYPYSGFSFMGEYWGSGNKCSILESKNGDITISGEQPFVSNEVLKLVSKDDVSVHDAVLNIKENNDCEELLGLWRCVSERDGESHEITLSFDKNGVFKAEDKEKDQTPRIFIGNYNVSMTEDGIVGDIVCEAAGYGNMPYEWVLEYDESQKCPLIYDDYMYAEPFTYKEDDKNLPFKKVDSQSMNGFTPGPGDRADEVLKMYNDYVSESYKYGEDNSENNAEYTETEYLEDAIFYAHEYTNAPCCDVESVEDGPNGKVVTVHCYEIVKNDEKEHTVTWDWIYYEVETGKVTDFFGNEIIF